MNACIRIDNYRMSKWKAIIHNITNIWILTYWFIHLWNKRDESYKTHPLDISSLWQLKIAIYNKLNWLNYKNSIIKHITLLEDSPFLQTFFLSKYSYFIDSNIPFTTNNHSILFPITMMNIPYYISNSIFYAIYYKLFHSF